MKNLAGSIFSNAYLDSVHNALNYMHSFIKKFESPQNTLGKMVNNEE